MVIVSVSDFVVSSKSQSLTDILAVRASRALNSIGSIELVVPQGTLRNLVPGRILTVTTEEGIYNCYLVRKVVETKNRTTIIGQDFNSLLDNRIVAYAAGSPQASKTGAADNVLKQVVRENLGGDTSSSRSLTNYGVTVENDLSLFPNIDIAFAWDSLRNVADKIVAVMAQAGERMFWSFEARNQNQIVFIVRKNSLYGEVFQPQKYIGFLQEAFELGVDYTEEVNTVYAGGTGTGSNRIIVTATLEHTPITRVERFYDLSNLSSSSQLQNAAKSKLKAAVKTVKVQSNDLPSHLFGKTLTINLLDETYQLICKRVTVQVIEREEAVTEWESI